MGNFTNVQNFYFLIPLAIAPIICYNNLTKTLKSVSQYKGYSDDTRRNKEVFARRKFVEGFALHQGYRLLDFKSARKVGRSGRRRNLRRNRRRNEYRRLRSGVCFGRDFRPGFAVRPRLQQVGRYASFNGPDFRRKEQR